jgi:hypothetical protein
MSKKYHESHPTISFRCRSIEEYTKIKDVVKLSGKSESDLVREGVLKVVEKESKSYLMGLNHVAWFCPGCNEINELPITEIFEEQSLINFLVWKYGEFLFHSKCRPKDTVGGK